MKATVKKEHLSRLGWLFLALLFVVTGLGVGVYAFWASIHQDNSANNTTASTTMKLEGTKLENFTPVQSIPELQTIDQKVGTGEEAKSNSTVTLDYTGAVAATGVIFQSSLDGGQPITYPLDKFVPGFTQGVTGMKVGGTRRILIPYLLAYKDHPPPGIPSNADLVFDVTLHKVQ